MCIAGKIGAKIKVPQNNLDIHKYLFGEDQSRYIIEVSKKNKNEVSKILEENNIYYDIIGKTQNDRISLENEFDVKLSELEKLNTFWFRNYFKYN